MLNSLRQVTGFLLLMTLITGVAYPLLVTGMAQTIFPHQANGSRIERDGRIVGSSLIAQNFSGPGYFHPRPSAAGSKGYDAMSSGGSNLGVATKANNDAVAARVAAARHDGKAVPADLVMASASGLDPHLSPAAAHYQIAAVAAARGLPLERVAALVEAHTEGRQFGIFGEPRVNVLELNLALDAQHP
ncbi:MAG: potassium-transporting ATPase subunit [Hydrocarboniphaga sp.]|uniref:potassium-transporting ATPase subunit KdpC n=1 Tax=Hydrocarboniphaga sp. TaxID=2033016 RepID=UPI00262B4F30|nr:potassium-transporting ATPase subunit KdpC [Hydrocarboniphaga sp.]MDB5972747.1 potassium-transporting ATPase subunit [Hydrocarboniphaga sp.]